MTPENESFIKEWNKKSQNNSQLMKALGITDWRKIKVKARALKKYLTCTREDGKLSARGVAIEETAPAAKTVKVAKTEKVSKAAAAEMLQAEEKKKVKLEFRDKSGNTTQTREIQFANEIELVELIRSFAASMSFDKTVIEAADGSSLSPAAVKDGDTVVIRPNISGASN